MLKLEQELSEAKALQLKLSAKTSFLVSDIRKVCSEFCKNYNSHLHVFFRPGRPKGEQ